MPRVYSTYEAKAKLSELLDRVRKGDTVTITHRGEPVAELRPVARAEGSLERRLEDLRRAGVVSPRGDRGGAAPLAARKGALRRFLEERE